MGNEVEATEGGRLAKWKRIALRSFFIGLGLAVGIAATLSAWMWLASRPSAPVAWNGDALVVRGYPGFSAWGDTVRLSYTVRNTTREDYGAEDATGLRLFFRTKGDSALVAMPREWIETPVFIPAGENGRIQLLLVLDDLPRQAPTQSDSGFHEAVRASLNENADNLGGFVFYDDGARYRIVLSRWRAQRPTTDEE